MAKELAVVIGANRGIGLEFCRQLLDRGFEVVAACRSTSPELAALGATVVQGVDITHDDGCAPLLDALHQMDAAQQHGEQLKLHSVAGSSSGAREGGASVAEAVAVAVAPPAPAAAAAAAAAGGRQVHLLVLNAGLLVVDTLATLGGHFGDAEQQFRANALGPLRVAHALRQRLRAGSKVLLLSSRMGSLELAPGRMYGYRMSKAAANMAGRCLAGDLKAAGVAVGMVHPGAVETEMYRTYNSDARNAPSAPRPPALSPPESVAAMLRVARELLTLESSGGFWTHEGAAIPW